MTTDPQIATQAARAMYQDSAAIGYGEEQFQGLRGSSEDMSNRSMLMTRDIMALLGFVEQDVRFL